MKAIYGGEEGWFNLVRNCFRPGPATRSLDGEWLEISTSETTSTIPGNYYILENEYDVTAVRNGGFEGGKPDYPKISDMQRHYDHVSKSSPYLISVPLEMVSQKPCEAYKEVLKSAGASYRRDAFDKRIISEVRKGKATYNGSVTGLPGIIDSEKDVLN